jgi:DUF4097 and DUF4098 domain-containing protein YvlB
MRFDELVFLRPVSAVAWLALAALAVPWVAQAGEEIHRSTTADPTGTVEVSNITGSVKVMGWTRNEVQVTGELGEGAERLEFTKGDKVTRIAVITPNHSGHADDSDLEISVPLGSALSINTVSADVQVQNVRGAQRLQTVSGDVQTQSSGEDVECRTVSGDVTIDGSGKKGLVSITTVSGDATANRVAGEVNGSTVSGTFRLGVGETSRSRLRSTSGDISLNGPVTPDARVDIESISGDVRLDFVGNAPADYDISTFNGEIRNCFGPKSQRTSEYSPGRELRFTEGQGTARIRVKTMNGDIGLCRK